MRDFQTHIENAIDVLNKEIKTLEKIGTRNGCLVQSPTSNGKSYQWHWAIGSKRVYVKKSLKPTYAAVTRSGGRAMKWKLVECWNGNLRLSQNRVGID